MEKQIKLLTIEQLNGPMPDVRYRHIFPTLYHVCSKIFIVHTAEHVRMLSVWKHFLIDEN